MKDGLPGADLIEAGLADLWAGRDGCRAFGGDRRATFTAFGFATSRCPSRASPVPLLARDDSDSAHSRYNAFVRRLASYERAAECVQGISLRIKVEEFLAGLPKETHLIH